MEKIVNEELYLKIKEIINSRRKSAKKAIDSEILAMNWCIGQLLFTDVLKEHKAEYGKKSSKL